MAETKKVLFLGGWGLPSNSCTTDGQTFSVGQLYDFKDKACVGSICLGNNEWRDIQCGSVKKTSKWVIEEDDSVAFPSCCPHAVPPLNIVPDLLKRVPGTERLHVLYNGHNKVDLGNELAPVQVFDKPTVSWCADPSAYYTLLMTDPDAPSRSEPVMKEFRHWLVANIPGDNVDAGEVLTEYVGSGAPEGSGLHRYTFLLYRQPERLTFDEPWVGQFTWTYRVNFTTTAFAEKYGLCDPVAINVFQAQYDESVQKVLKMIEFV